MTQMGPVPAAGPPRRIAIVGTGLIGTSIGLAVREAGWDVVLYDASPEVLGQAVDLGAGRAGGVWPPPAAGTPAREPATSTGPSGRTASLAPGAPTDRQADLCVVAVPPSAAGKVLAQAWRARLATTVVDVSSVKVRPLADALAAGVPAEHLVGSHPMAGRERGGPGAGRGDLFDGRVWVVCPESAGAPDVERVRDLIEVCGAAPVTMTAPAHDEAVAVISHVPHVMAALTSARLADAAEEVVALSGQGVRDVTRVAASEPSLWRDILASNAVPVRRTLELVRADLDELITALGAHVAGPGVPGPGGAARVEAVLRAGALGRARLPGKHGKPATTFVAVPVVIADRPGELARLLTAAGEADVNVEDIAIEHSPGSPVGLIELFVQPGSEPVLAGALRDGGWVVHL